MKWSNQLKATPAVGRSNRDFGLLTKLVSDTFDTWALKYFVVSQRVQGPGETVACSPIIFLPSTQNSAADEGDTENKTTVKGPTETFRAKVAQRSYQGIFSSVHKKKKVNSDFVPNKNFTSMAKKWTKTTHYPTWRQFSTTYIEPSSSAKLNQIELNDEEKEVCKVNTQQGLIRMCWLPRSFKSASITHSKTSKAWLSSKTTCLSTEHHARNTKSIWRQLMDISEKQITISETKSNPKPLKTVSFSGYSLSADGLKIGLLKRFGAPR